MISVRRNGIRDLQGAYAWCVDTFGEPESEDVFSLPTDAVWRYQWYSFQFVRDEDATMFILRWK